MKLLLPRFKGFAGTQAVYYEQPRVVDLNTGREVFGYKGGDDEIHFRRAYSQQIQAFRIVEEKEFFLSAPELMDIIEMSKKRWEESRSGESWVYEPFYAAFGNIEYPSMFSNPEKDDEEYKEWKKKKES